MKYKAITENHLYRKAYAKGRKFCGKYLALYVLPDYAAKKIQKADPQKRACNRIGISTSKKIGGAVVRSRVRRIIREGYRQISRELTLQTGKLVVIAARSAAAEVKSTDIARELRVAVRETGLCVEKA